MEYPLDFSFKIIAIASQIYVRDAGGSLIGYVKQKLFKLKEDINVFADESQTHLLYNIKADRVIDFSPKFNFTNGGGTTFGSVKRKGMRSIWRANYEIYDAGGTQVMKINEENGWVKVVDSLVGELPVVGIFTGYFFNPSYIVSRMNDAPVARLKKQSALFEGKFRLEPLDHMSDDEKQRVFLSVLTMTLLERARG